VDYSVLNLLNECILLREIDNQLSCSGLDLSQLNCIISFLGLYVVLELTFQQFTFLPLCWITGSPTGLSRVTMASAVVVPKHETSTLRQRHNFISIDFKFGVGDYAMEVTHPDKVGLGPMSGRDATWGQHIRVLWLFLYSSTELQPIPVKQFSRTIAQKTRSGIRKTLFWMRNL